MSTIRPFAQDASYTQVHNYVFDEIMPRLSPNSFKVLCLIIRKTTGWHKEEDAISYSQIMSGTGIKNRNTISTAVDELVQCGYIVAQKAPHSTSHYRINKEYEICTSNEGEYENRTSGQYENCTTSSTEIVPVVVQKSYTQKKERKKEIYMSATADRADPTPPENMAARSRKQAQPPKDEPTPELREMHAMMARVCKIDMSVATKETKINLYRVCGLFAKNGHTAEDIKTFGLWWYKEHWLGKQKKAPTLRQVQDNWTQAFEQGMPLEDEADRYVDPFERMLRQKSEELRQRREMQAAQTQAAA